MIHVLSVALFTALVATCYASSPAGRSVHYETHETRPPAADHWVKGDRVEPDAPIQLKIALTQSNLGKGHDMLMEVADPDSIKYAQHYTADEVNAIFAPSETTIASVRRWLDSSGVDSDRITLTLNRGWFIFESSIKEAETLFSTEYYYFKNILNNKIRLACDKYSLPGSLKEHIDYVSPGVGLDDLGHPQSHKPTDSVTKKAKCFGDKKEERPLPKACLSNEIATPECVRELYAVPAPKYKTPNPDNAMGIYEEQERFSQIALDKFFINYYLAIPNGTAPIINRIDGARINNTAFDDGESSLDFEIAFPLVYPQNITLFQVPGVPHFNNHSIFTALLDAIDGSFCVKSKVRGKRHECGTFKPTNVISISYGQPEAYLPVPLLKRQCNEFLKLGLQGVSVVLSSGDFGVGTAPTFPGTFNTCLGKSFKVYSPQWPASCPYVTTVGGTKIFTENTSDENTIALEKPVHFGGGGFSNVYTRAKYAQYQQKAVEYFFIHYNPPFPSFKCKNNNYPRGRQNARYNRIGRGFPDVVADSGPVLIELGYAQPAYGTSVSAPIVASILNRINEERLDMGKKPIGFANPAFYKNPSMFNDINCGFINACLGLHYGFNATDKWDPTTGLGTPNYPKMLDYFMSLP